MKILSLDWFRALSKWGACHSFNFRRGHFISLWPLVVDLSHVSETQRVGNNFGGRYKLLNSFFGGWEWGWGEYLKIIFPSSRTQTSTWHVFHKHVFNEHKTHMKQLRLHLYIEYIYQSPLICRDKLDTITISLMF